HAERTHLLAGRDERASDVPVLDEAVAERDAAVTAEALGRGDAGLGDPHDEVGLDGRLLGELLPHPHPRLVDALAVQDRIGARVAYGLDQAPACVDAVAAAPSARRHAVLVDDDTLARV